MALSLFGGKKHLHHFVEEQDVAKEFFALLIRILDPTLTSEGNKIKNNQTIYIRRVQVETKTS
ncbi:hypothetical protein FE931_09285 [Parabacteroides distasonis]|nr:hypothetical protein FE931_09285 [Parabacteroides distasonis]